MLDEGYGKTDTRVISKTFAMLRKLWNFSRSMSNEEKTKEKNDLKLFDNTRNPDHSGFITLTFNGVLKWIVRKKQL